MNTLGPGNGSRRGFSIAELIIVIAIILVLTAVAVINIAGTLKSADSDSAAQLIVQQMRLARQYAISDRKIYRLTFTSPSAIAIDRLHADNSFDVSVSMSAIPQAVGMQIETGVPTSSITAPYTPDNIGTAVKAVDFNGGNEVYFQPDGAGRDASGKIISGVIYVSNHGELSSARAITLFGSTGRIKAWKIQFTDGAWSWQ